MKRMYFSHQSVVVTDTQCDLIMAVINEKSQVSIKIGGREFKCSLWKHNEEIYQQPEIVHREYDPQDFIPEGTQMNLDGIERLLVTTAAIRGGDKRLSQKQQERAKQIAESWAKRRDSADYQEWQAFERETSDRYFSSRTDQEKAFGRWQDWKRASTSQEQEEFLF